MFRTYLTGLITDSLTVGDRRVTIYQFVVHVYVCVCVCVSVSVCVCMRVYMDVYVYVCGI